MKSAIEIRDKLDRAIDDYLYSRLSYANKSHFRTDELKEIYQHYHNFINAVHEFIIKRRLNKMESYTQLKQRHEKEFSELKGIFFAFSTEQFNEGMSKIDLQPNQVDLIVRFAMGSYCLKSTYPQLQELVDRHEKEMNLLKNDPERFVKALVYELQNHEYCYSYETDDSLEVFGLTNETVDPELLARAIEICEKNYSLHN